MLCCSISKGALYYGKTRKRKIVKFTKELRDELYSVVFEMHELFKKGSTPKASKKIFCKSCSLKDLCLPDILKDNLVDDYFKERLEKN